MPSSNLNPPKQISFGILTLPFQVTDVSAPLDILSCITQSCLSTFGPSMNLSPDVISGGIADLRFHHVAPTLEPMELTAGFTIVPSTTFKECPPLDYLIIGGPEPEWVSGGMGGWEYEYGDFLRGRVAEAEAEAAATNDGDASGEGQGKEKKTVLKAVFTNCTGAMVLAHTGLLDGRRATVNHMAIDMAREMAPRVKWTAEKQWITDGMFWTAGGAMAGMDMLAQWTIDTFGRDVAQAGFGLLDLQPRDVEGRRVLLGDDDVKA